MPVELSKAGLYWAASTFAQSTVALLAFGAFIAIWRMDKLHFALVQPLQILGFAIERCELTRVRYQDPKRGRDLIDLREYMSRIDGGPPPIEVRDPGEHVESLVLASRYYLNLQARTEADAEAETLVLERAAGGDPFGFGKLQAELDVVAPVARLLSQISFWLKSTSIAGMLGFAFAMVLAGTAEVVVALPRSVGFLVVSSFAIVVIATTASASMLARWCFAPVGRR